MRHSDLKAATDEALLEGYVDEVLQQSAAHEASVANRHAKGILRIAHELRRRGQQAQVKLLPLLEHPNPHVRSWAATHTLILAPEKAESVLRALTKEPGAIGLDAKLTLQEWSKGTLLFP